MKCSDFFYTDAGRDWRANGSFVNSSVCLQHLLPEYPCNPTTCRTEESRHSLQVLLPRKQSSTRDCYLTNLCTHFALRIPVKCWKNTFHANHVRMVPLKYFQKRENTTQHNGVLTIRKIEVFQCFLLKLSKVMPLYSQTGITLGQL